mmetsp:Transcript_130332/g.225682  ORF Transcript_130332/g.225682 Transcript_130332/m.225682 type:complete len:208 (+) Transcript_130332:1577-2200(+)
MCHCPSSAVTWRPLSAGSSVKLAQRGPHVVMMLRLGPHAVRTRECLRVAKMECPVYFWASSVQHRHVVKLKLVCQVCCGVKSADEASVATALLCDGDADADDEVLLSTVTAAPECGAGRMGSAAHELCQQRSGLELRHVVVDDADARLRDALGLVIKGIATSGGPLHLVRINVHGVAHGHGTTLGDEPLRDFGLPPLLRDVDCIGVP